MLFNNLKIAFRQLSKYKFYSLINIGGLTVSVACSIIILLFIRHELSYDRYHDNADRIYRLALDINLNQSEDIGIALPAPIGPTIVEEFPEIESAARINVFFADAGANNVRVSDQSESIYQERFIYADQSFTDIFNVDPIHGDPSSWLTEPNTIIIGESNAQRLFGNLDPIGQTLILNEDNNAQYRVTGVFHDLPSNTHLAYDYLMSMATLGIEDEQNWINNAYFGYVKLREGVDAASLQNKLYAFGLKYFAPQFREQLNIDISETRKEGVRYDLFMQPLSEVHLHSEGFTPYMPGGDIRYIRLFGAIAIFLVLIAMVNFINLSTARSANRAKEVGMRKVLGSVRPQLIGQFLAESTMVSSISFLLGLILAYQLLPFFNQLSGKELLMPLGSTWFLPMLVVGALATGLLSGMYPAFYLSSFRPIKVLKGRLSLGTKSGLLRKGLVVFQFAISVGLIISTLVVLNQMHFIQNKKIGFERDQVILIHDTQMLGDRVSTFKENLKRLPETKNASTGAFLPLEGGFRSQNMFHYEKNLDPSARVPIQAWNVDEDYISTLEMKLIAGRDFDADRANEANSVILNESAVRQLGIEEPVGKRIKSPFSETLFTVIGIVEDFHFDSLKDEIYGLGLFLGRNTSTVAVKINPTGTEAFIQKAKDVWTQFMPQQALRYTFLDDRFKKMYEAEQRAARLFNIFTGLAIFIACLGLLALATFTAEQRTKEIGIRKVLGASATGIVRMLSKDFLGLVLISIVVAAPIAYWYMEKWLANFAYRIEIQWWVFLIAGLAATLLAFLTVSIQSLRAALANPVDAIKSE